MKMILLIAGLMMTQFLILDTDDFDAFLNRVDKRDIETEAILCCAASETFLKQHPGFGGTLNTEIKLVDGNIVFHNFRNYMTGQKEETFRFPSTNIKAQL